jgi:hypothetical protein
MPAKKPASLKRQGRETPTKTPLRKPEHGNGALRVGNPGNKGGGRPPDEFKRLCASLASGDATVEQVKTILENATHPAFVSALKWATEHGYGKAKDSLEISGKDGGPIAMTVTFRK